MTDYFEDLNFDDLDYDINENEELQDYLDFEKKKKVMTYQNPQNL